MFHLEVRQFPHAAWRFNLSEQQIRQMLAPWMREKVIDVGERKWSPHKATLTILEGPELELQELSMGRGWRNAQRRGSDVTERMLAQLAPEPAAGSTSHVRALASDSAAAGEPLAVGIELAPLLGGEPLELLEAWRASASSGLKPSESLALAEQELAQRKSS